MLHPRSALFLAALSATGLPSFAQAQAPAAAVAPPGKPLEHRSAFEGYRPFAAEEVQPWRQSNDTVRSIGGWRAYAREISGAQTPSAPAAKASEPDKAVNAAKPADPHSGHRKP